MEQILEINRLTKTFKKQTVVDEVSFGVTKNSVYGLLGPNGAGKSTTLKMITGMLQPSSGSISFEGHTWSREDLRKIGALIETPPLYDNLTARDNLRVKTIMLGLPESRIDEVLQTVDLTGTGRKRAGCSLRSSWSFRGRNLPAGKETGRGSSYKQNRDTASGRIETNLCALFLCTKNGKEDGDEEDKRKDSQKPCGVSGGCVYVCNHAGDDSYFPCRGGNRAIYRGL